MSIKATVRAAALVNDVLLNKFMQSLAVDWYRPQKQICQENAREP
jgi:hypothetical protein